MKFCDSVQGWRRRWFYLKDRSHPGERFGVAPFNVDASFSRRRSWRHEVSDEEVEATEGLMAAVEKLAAHKNFGAQLVALFVKRRVQPLQARITPMWEYSGPTDPTRTREEELSKDEYEDRLRAVTNLREDKDMPGKSPVAPFGLGNKPTEVNLDLVFSFSLRCACCSFFFSSPYCFSF